MNSIWNVVNYSLWAHLVILLLSASFLTPECQNHEISMHSIQILKFSNKVFLKIKSLKKKNKPNVCEMSAFSCDARVYWIYGMKITWFCLSLVRKCKSLPSWECYISKACVHCRNSPPHDFACPFRPPSWFCLSLTNAPLMILLVPFVHCNSVFFLQHSISLGVTWSGSPQKALSTFLLKL